MVSRTAISHDIVDGQSIFHREKVNKVKVVNGNERKTFSFIIIVLYLAFDLFITEYLFYKYWTNSTLCVNAANNVGRSAGCMYSQRRSRYELWKRRYSKVFLVESTDFLKTEIIPWLLTFWRRKGCYQQLWPSSRGISQFLTWPAVNIAVNNIDMWRVRYHVIASQLSASQLSGHCDVISNRLWRHQQNENRVSETRGRCVKLVVFIVIYGFVMSCKKYINVITLLTNRSCAHSSAILVFISRERWNGSSREYIHYSLFQHRKSQFWQIRNGCNECLP